eukprot:TRINITY_DN18617_c0_g4_i1.p3 TRINITY_DN18617_c0_g4~~TRINITY_DN18617_c0_g4_i1.p3  ORF type:complete len:156 (+),score=31.26 TRINITY_DN18617_c0_g4_i1:1224-1691(+)
MMVALPGSVIIVQSLDTSPKRIIAKDGQIAFRLSASRTALDSGTNPDIEKVSRFARSVSAELEIKAAKDETQTEKKQPQVPKVNALDGAIEKEIRKEREKEKLATGRGNADSSCLMMVARQELHAHGHTHSYSERTKDATSAAAKATRNPNVTEL